MVKTKKEKAKAKKSNKFRTKRVRTHFPKANTKYSRIKSKGEKKVSSTKIGAGKLVTKVTTLLRRLLPKKV